jgi:hypothetical protein
MMNLDRRGKKNRTAAIADDSAWVNPMLEKIFQLLLPQPSSSVASRLHAEPAQRTATSAAPAWGNYPCNVEAVWR